jgi:hypothetical protein
MVGERMKKFITIFILVLFTSQIMAKIPRVFVSVKQKDIKANDTVEILIGAEAKKGSKFKLPKIDTIGGFKVLSKKGKVTYRILDKNETKIPLVKRVIKYTLKPTKSFDMARYEILIDGKKFNTVAFRVKVATTIDKASTKVKPKKQESQKTETKKTEPTNKKPASKEPKKQESKAIENSNISAVKQVEPNIPNQEPDNSLSSNFIFKMSSSKKELVVGESFIVKVELIEPINLSSQDLNYFPPKFSGFKFQPIGDGKIEESSDSVIRTIEYLVTPTKSGTLTITPARAKVSIALAAQGQSPFGFFGNDIEWKKLTTNKLTFNVKEIPKKVDLVGKFKIETIISTQKAKANKPYDYTIKITGLGDLDDYEAPKINIDNITIYNEDAEIKHIMTKGVVVTSYSKKYTFLSDKDFTIPAIKIKVYNPERKKVYTLKSKEVNVKIKKINSISSILSSSNTTKKDSTTTKEQPKVKTANVSTTLNSAKVAKQEPQEIKKVEELLLDKSYYKRKYSNGYPLNAIFGALFLGLILGVAVTILLPGIIRVKKSNAIKSKPYSSYEEALNILYPHTTKSSAIEDMVAKLYEVTNGNKELKIDEYALTKMIKKVKAK